MLAWRAATQTLHLQRLIRREWVLGKPLGHAVDVFRVVLAAE